MIATGVDGARGGWMVARAHDDGSTSVELVPRFAAAGPGAGVVAVDMPIGLPRAVELRACDRAARALLGPRRSSVFFAPPRWALDAGSYEEVQRRVAERGGRGLSRQAFGLVPKVRELDDHLRAHRSRAEDVVEAHPELAFLALSGGRPLPAKRTPAGAARREALVLDRFPGAVLPARLRGDALDAYAVLATALAVREGSVVALGDGSVDEHGLPMRIVMPPGAAPPPR